MDALRQERAHDNQSAQRENQQAHRRELLPAKSFCPAHSVLSNTFQERNLYPIISTHEIVRRSRLHLPMWMSLLERWLHFNQENGSEDERAARECPESPSFSGPEPGCQCGENGFEGEDQRCPA